VIPFFQFSGIIVGPLTIQVWGILVSLGIILGVWRFHILARRQLLSTAVVLDLAVAVIAGGLLGGRLGHVLFYEPWLYLQHPAEIFAFWHGGASSLGGFIGGGIAAALFFYRRKFTLKEWVPYLDAGVVSLWLGWGVGRLGCFLIHDHPGTLTYFIGAVQYPGGARHDLGLYESVVGFTLFIIFSLLYKTLSKRQPGLVAGISIAGYAVARFFLDFLRARDLPESDVRYFALTPAQWGMLLLFVGLTVLFICGKIKAVKKKPIKA
jgi:phosphatidylglycerol---prolipoprotein diacylglyceryl transferase